ncbi:hypothetical protein P1J78_08235 [Psychromarinibacter sp. C21-152]|uniref:Uncharacterized protein n=1 Tax=Psychromarinibacter sediminicola TaxID=3033385 RepID=A0AAE3T9N3_9RHOB|nr:hypothetical protein [Psychromarinibacter sediminicola]MDF0600715.1 hypothetical protein [Psychromarinibacter sediminicola]
MFNLQQQALIQAGAAAVVIFFLALILGAGFGASVLLGLVGGIAVLFWRREKIRSSGGGDILRGPVDPAPFKPDDTTTTRDPAPAPPDPAAAPDRAAPAEAERPETSAPAQAEPERPKAPDAPAPAPEPAPAATETKSPADAAVSEDEHKPATLDAPRGGQADNLKRITGIGPKLEQHLNEAGIYHFDQIAAWTPAEVSWVDSSLPGVNGRATRDDWVGQAREFAAGS